MAETGGRERELVLGPTEYASVLDETKGNVTVYVGPQKTSLSNTDRPVVFDPETGTFSGCGLSEAITVFPTADEGSYIVLHNPVVDGSEAHPKTGSNMSAKLLIGRRVNIPGPVSFPLWPGQAASVLEGHRLRSNQYVVVRVYNDEAATKYWGAAVVKPQTAGNVTDQPKGEGKEAAAAVAAGKPQLTMGQLLVIKGTNVSFYIPPTGVEVVPEKPGQFIRDAVTLEQLEGCILLDENGERRYVWGPAVVFPKPTEVFIEKNGSRKFRAIELNEDMGLHLKVIAPYKDDNGVDHETGEELFITGREQKLYYPRPEHAVVKYGDEEIYFAVAIPAGEARYVLNKQTGENTLVKGPRMFLPDPRREVLMRRVLDQKTVGLWYPGNQEALAYNAKLAAMTRGQPEQFVAEREVTRSLRATATLSSVDEVQEGFAGASFGRRSDFTPPRVITLDTKYQGAPSVNVFTGYAVQVVGKSGNRRVVIGPATVILEYDETLEVIEMSTGTPKSDARIIKDVYLRVQNNRVSDRIEGAETGDLVRVSIPLSYRVNFEGDPNKWFGVENYIKLLTEHLRSMIRGVIKRHGIEEVNRNAVAIIRDTVLGVAVDGGQRPGRTFEENGMRVYDVEVLDLVIGDEEIAARLVDAQHKSVQQALDVARAESDLEKTQRLEEVARKQAEAKAETVLHGLRLAQERSAEQLKLDLANDEIQRQRNTSKAETEVHGLKLAQEKSTEQLKSELAEIARKAKTRDEELTAALAAQQQEAKVAEGKLAMSKADADQKLALQQAEQQLELAQLEAEVKAVVEKAKAFGPEVVAALQAFGDKDLVGKVSQSMAPLAILGGKSVADIISNMLSGTVLEGVMKLAGANGNLPHQVGAGRAS